VLGQVSPRSSSVTLVLPDTVVRVFVLDFDSLPAKPVELTRCCAFACAKWCRSTWSMRA
jgi:type IV pilus assembly protein PilM